MKTKKLAELSMLTAVSLIIFIIELRVPNLINIPGVKLGLANIVTVYAVYSFSGKEVFLMLVTRIFLGAVFSSNFSAILYSFSGGMFCLCGMLIIRRIIPIKYIWLCSIIGAVLHNTGQILMAVIVLRTFSVIGFYPFLIVSGCIAGLFTGLCAQFVIQRINQKNHNKKEGI